MTSSQYKNIIRKSLNRRADRVQNGSLETVREILANCGEVLPKGTCREIEEILKTDNYMYWRECTSKQAQQNANAGIATIDFKDGGIYIIEPEDGVVAVEHTFDSADSDADSTSDEAITATATAQASATDDSFVELTNNENGGF